MIATVTKTKLPNQSEWSIEPSSITHFTITLAAAEARAPATVALTPATKPPAFPAHSGSYGRVPSSRRPREGHTIFWPRARRALLLPPLTTQRRPAVARAGRLAPVQRPAAAPRPGTGGSLSQRPWKAHVRLLARLRAACLEEATGGRGGEGHLNALYAARRKLKGHHGLLPTQNHSTRKPAPITTLRPSPKLLMVSRVSPRVFLSDAEVRVSYWRSGNHTLSKENLERFLGGAVCGPHPSNRKSAWSNLLEEELLLRRAPKWYMTVGADEPSMQFPTSSKLMPSSTAAGVLTRFPISRARFRRAARGTPACAQMRLDKTGLSA
jgi:hypothetical protein